MLLKGAVTVAGTWRCYRYRYREKPSHRKGRFSVVGFPSRLPRVIALLFMRGNVSDSLLAASRVLETRDSGN